MTDEIITAKDHLEPITIQEMINQAPSLFCASGQFLIIEPYLELALK